MLSQEFQKGKEFLYPEPDSQNQYMLEDVYF